MDDIKLLQKLKIIIIFKFVKLNFPSKDKSSNSDLSATLGSNISNNYEK